MVKLMVVVVMMMIMDDVFLFRSAAARWSLRWSGAQEGRLLELILIKRMFGQYGDEKDEKEPELEIENFLKSDLKMISICKILDFMFLD